jgi:hypothetical protein
VNSNRFVLTRFPEEATEKDYAEAAAELDTRLAELTEVVAVYSFGAVHALGISDIDRIAVVDGARSVPEIWSRLSMRTRVLAMHTPFLIDSATFVRHRWFADLGVPELVSGRKIDVEERPIPEYSELLLAAEALVVMCLKLAKLTVTGRVKIRPLLCELNNLKLDLEFARLRRDEAGAAWALADEVGRLRTEWWQLEDRQRRSRMRALLARAPRALDAALSALAKQLENGEVATPVPLAAEWSNVTLVPGIERNGRPVGANLVGRSRRLGEARWRWIDRRFEVPAPVLRLLAGPSRQDYQEFRLQRSDLVRQHAEHLLSSPAYSAIGLAGVYLI